jgi:hypothetical protein
MANITIQDSGYISTNNAGTRATSANMANSGNAINLKSVDIKFSSKGNLDNSPLLGAYGVGTDTSVGSTVNIASVENLGFTITGILNMADATDQSYLVPLIQLPRTRWYKLLYYNSLSGDYSEQTLYQLSDDTFTAGEVTTFSLGGQYKHLHVMVSSVDVSQSSTNIVKFSIVGFITKKI